MASAYHVCDFVNLQLHFALASEEERPMLTSTTAARKTLRQTWIGEASLSTFISADMPREFRLTLLSGVAVAALFHAPAAIAQDGATAAELVQNPPSSDIIVVTAQRQDEAIEEVPISMTVISGDAAQDLNIDTIDEIELVTPGLIFETGATFPQTYIRGIGVATPTPGLEAPVALYVDGAYVPRSVGTLFDLIDIGSVQVLRGPQGTLYGRNATGGAILLNTADPTDITELRGSLEYGRFNHLRGEAALNLPASDTLAFRFAGAYSHEDGFVTNIATNRRVRGFDSYLLRGKVRWQPTPDLTAIIGAEWQRIEIESPAVGHQVAPVPFCVPCLLGVQNAPGFFQVNNDVEIHSPRRSWYTYLDLTYRTGAITLRSLTNYRDVYTRSASDVDQSSLSLQGVIATFGGGTFEQGVQITSSFDGWLNFLAGIQYIDDEAFSRFSIHGDLLGIPKETPEEQQIYSDGDVNTESFAAYAEFYFEPVEDLTITLGGRYSTDSRSIETTISPIAQLFFNPTGSATFFQDVSYDNFTPRAVLAYDTGNVNLYASYTNGFKAGGFNTPAFAPQAMPIAPEDIDSYEIGAKYVSPDRRTRIDAAAFLYNHSNVQVSIIDVASGGQVIENAARSRGWGLELSISHRLSEWLTLNAAGAYLNAEYRSYPDAQVYLVAVDAMGNPLGYVNGTEDLSGFRLPRAPRLTLSGSADIRMPIGDSWEVRLTPSVRYTSSYDFIAGAGGPTRQSRQEPLTLVNLSGGVGPSTGEYEIGFYIENLTDERYYSQIVTSVFGYETYVEQPITYGARVRFRF